MKGGQLVLRSFDSLGGDPLEAVIAAGSFESPGGWITSQATQAAAVGAGTMIIPGVHLLAFGLDLGVVMHKIAYTAWGIGRLLGCPVDGKLDLALVLATWTDTIDDAMLTDAVTASAAGITAGTAAVAGPVAFMATLISAVSGESTAAVLAALGAVGAVVTAGKTADILVGKAAEHALPYYGKKIMTKISSKVATKIATASAGKLIPIVGAVVAATVNAIIVRAVGRAAVRYYTAKRRSLLVRRAALGPPGPQLQGPHLQGPHLEGPQLQGA